MVPSQTRAGAGFQVQPDGNSAIWIECIGATPDTVIVWDGANLQTTFGGTAVSGLVPRSLYAEAGRKAVSLLDTATGLRSEPAVFDVKPRARP